MPSTHHSILLHVIYSTKNRVKVLTDALRTELFAYMGGTIKDHKASLLEAGGIEDHLHLLIRAHPSYAISDTVRLIKSNSSRWINEERKLADKFEWQKGYGVFSVSQSLRKRVSSYIQNQRQHHAKQSSEDEYFQTLQEHEIEFDERYVFDEEIVA